MTRLGKILDELASDNFEPAIRIGRVGNEYVFCHVAARKALWREDDIGDFMLGRYELDGGGYVLIAEEIEAFDGDDVFTAPKILLREFRP